jgi:hypothetical protein
MLGSRPTLPGQVKYASILASASRWQTSGIVRIRWEGVLAGDFAALTLLAKANHQGRRRNPFPSKVSSLQNKE